MQVILLKDVKGNGKKNDLLNVSDGYAKNFLIPRKLAIKAEKQNIVELKASKESDERKMQKKEANAKEVSKQLHKKSVVVFIKASKEGKIFGSVTASQIASEIEKIYNVIVDKKKINVPKNIKSVGTHECEIKIWPNISTKIYVEVKQEVSC
ncbi:MAG: 50S ribosomal protein L9 [Oscillospiraceae bacterium]|jgi:large subunit ribosomal protein L9|nr:50S ribosomal protein L9 [Oscillospiraceae bacterium]